MVNVSITSNSSTTSGLDSTGRYNYLAIATMVIYSVIFLVGTMGNGLVIYVTGCRMKKTVNSIWFLNLALADFLFTAFLLFMIISVSQDYQWHFGHFMCKLNNFVGVVNMFASVFLLMAISLDRCLSIWVVVWAQNKRTTRKAQIITAVIWVAAVVCSIPYATFRGLRKANGKTYCTSISESPKLILTTFRFVMGFFIPFLVICISYVAIGIRARRLNRTRTRRSRRIIFSIVLAFFICWLPFHVVHFIELKMQTNPKLIDIVKTLGPIALCLAFMNSCLNPILYVFMCDEFQKKLKQSICVVLESALAEDRLSLMSSRSLSSHLSRISRKSESAAPTERKGTGTSLNFTECKVLETGERETLSTE
ncbi:chemokine-like receptor 1 isoform X1 [Seriola lalandi dorsalis]|uniref:chemokine-like receptor 1 isoform X1 n=1 Tax=Seriola lalandi dorsalis TaxID=1841481 RepID=UPI000C6FBBA8|nr:chemokine-like receptor 1 isoform X1 [Seriola lalandi dorsalis]XP_056236097.1 chemerin-like receptor 1 isoform X1 [Seriola aureovittata]